MGYVLADAIAHRILRLKPPVKSALVQIAFYADDDGRNARLGDRRLALGLGCSERQAERLQTELRSHGWLLDDGWHGHIKNRRIATERLEQCELVTAAYDRQTVGRRRKADEPATDDLSVAQPATTDNLSSTTDRCAQTTDNLPPDTVKTQPRLSLSEENPMISFAQIGIKRMPT